MKCQTDWIMKSLGSQRKVKFRMLLKPSGSSGVERVKVASRLCAIKTHCCQITRKLWCNGQAWPPRSQAIKESVEICFSLPFFCSKWAKLWNGVCHQFEGDWVEFFKGGTKETRVISSSTPFTDIRRHSKTRHSAIIWFQVIQDLDIA